MRRGLILSTATIAALAAIVIGLAVYMTPSVTLDAPHVSRAFIPAIKEACTARAGLTGAEIGYVFDDLGALRTLDPGDGSVTGLPATKLALLNDCLAAYPIDPPRQLPRDPYSRNLLYDYFSGFLSGCLESRVNSPLPPIPTRADFVVRLYNWDPYRALAPGRTLDELIELISDCPDVPDFLVGR